MQRRNNEAHFQRKLPANRFDSLQNSLNSVLEQDYENFEIIVVNDDSDDKRYYEKNSNEKIKFIHDFPLLFLLLVPLYMSLLIKLLYHI